MDSGANISWGDLYNYVQLPQHDGETSAESLKIADFSVKSLALSLKQTAAIQRQSVKHGLTDCQPAAALMDDV